METIKKYTFRLSSEKPNHIILNEKSIEKGHTDTMDIYASDSFDYSRTDREGNRITTGYRLTKDGRHRVEITIVNSYNVAQQRRNFLNSNFNS